MSFIGVIASNNDFKYLKQQTFRKVNNKRKKIEFIEINKISLKNFKNIKFETIIANTNLNNVIENEENIKNILKNAKYLILNSDLEFNKQILNDINLKIITYGLNHKSTITTSSITEEEILICLQRNILDIYKNIVEAQEFYVKKDNNNIYNILALATIFKIYNL